MPKFLGKITILIFLAMIVGSFWYWQKISNAQEELPLFVKEEPLEKIERPLYVPDEIIVKFKPGIQKNIIQEINEQQGTSEIYESPFARFKVLKIPTNKTVPEMVEIYKKNPNVEYAEPNSIAYAFIVPNDPYYQYQWNFDDNHTINPGGATSNPYGGANGGGIRMEDAWNITTGNSGVVVAIVDTGVAYENYGSKYEIAPDLTSTNFWVNTGEIPGNGIDDDGNGYIDDRNGWDFVNNDSHPNDDNSHGTHVAGTVAQSTNNNTGVAGIAFTTTIMPLKVLNKNGSGTASQITDALYYAANNGVKIVNMSLGWPPGYDPGTTVYTAVKYAYDHGVTQVAATGNDNASTISYPAKYAEVIAVGATRYDETRAPYSNYGEGIDLVAPGGDTSVDQNGDGNGDGVLQNTFNPTSKNPSDFGYWFFDGTSMSTPHVAGVAALLLAYNSSLTPDQVRNILQSTAEDKGAAGRDNTYGYGIVDAYAALLSLVPPVSITLTTDGSVNFGILGLGETKDTTPSGTNDVQTIKVDTGPANLSIRSTNFSDGTNTWMLGSTNGANQVKWESSKDTTSWSTFAVANTLYPLASSISQGSTQDVYFRLTMPTSTISNNPYSATVTIVATAP